MNSSHSSRGRFIGRSRRSRGQTANGRRSSWAPPPLRRSVAHFAVVTLVLAAGLLTLAPGPSGGIGLGAQPAAAKACKGARAKPGKISAGRASRAMTCLINRRRKSKRLPRVKARKPLRAAAKRQSRRMVRTGCVGHSCGGALVNRVYRTRYLPCGCAYGLGEALAWATGVRGKPRRIFRAWMRSPGHRSVLMDRRFRHIGLGVVWGAPGRGGSSAGTYTAVLGFKG